jgi:DNA invertase Pin-like site-specific DNA recombinase
VKFTVTNAKITLVHLALLAVVYIRRSCVRQVIEHKASGAHQRSFDGLARSYGWDDDLIKVIDIDDGRSGTDATKRTGFQWLRQQIFEGRVGAIFCWEASRLARDNSDFAQLIKLCAASNTLIVDEKAVYDPNNINDLVYLGLMGVLSHAESQRIGDRSKSTRLSMAKTGELHLRPATGYVYNNEGKLVLDPRKKVQEAIRLVFSTFEKYGSAGKVVKHFNRNKKMFPTLKKGRGKNGVIEWGKISSARALDILKNPAYAGTYVYGLSKTNSEMLAPDSSEQIKKKEFLSLDSDEVVIRHGHHEGFITWDKYTKNQKNLKDNCYVSNFASRGAIRDGSALLQGMVVCATCKTKSTTHYDGRDGSGNYTCDRGRKNYKENTCFSITARRLDRVVIDELMKAVKPAQLQLTIRELEEASRETKADDCSDLEELTQARAERDEAQMRLESINPRNKLVFRLYDNQLEEKMDVVRRLEKKHARALKTSRRELTDESLQLLSSLPQDLRAFWEGAEVTNAERKQLLRFLIHKVTVKRGKDSKYQDVIIHWLSGATTMLTIVANGRFMHPEAVALMRKLAPDHTVTQIIDHLHKAGFRSKGDKEWFSRDAVRQAFKAYGIECACFDKPREGDKPRGDGRYSTPAVAKMLNVSSNTISILCKEGVLDSVRNTPRGAQWIKISPEQVAALKKPYPIKRPRSKTS